MAKKIDKPKEEAVKQITPKTIYDILERMEYVFKYTFARWDIPEHPAICLSVRQEAFEVLMGYIKLFSGTELIDQKKIGELWNKLFQFVQNVVEGEFSFGYRRDFLSIFMEMKKVGTFVTLTNGKTVLYKGKD